jgi:hypothetical protein
MPARAAVPKPVSFPSLLTLRLELRHNFCYGQTLSWGRQASEHLEILFGPVCLNLVSAAWKQPRKGPGFHHVYWFVILFRYGFVMYVYLARYVKMQTCCSCKAGDI